MDFTALKQELSDRGFARLSDTQRGTLINRARAELDSMELWPYREASATGTAPLAVADLGFVEAVLNTVGLDSPIPMRSYSDLLRNYGDLSVTGGAPSYWYLAYPAGIPTVATFPVSTVTIGVQYWKVTADLSAGGDSPLSPARFHGLIVDIAEKRALRSKGDYAGVEAMQVGIDRELAVMRQDLLYRQSSGPSRVLTTDGADY